MDIVEVLKQHLWILLDTEEEKYYIITDPSKVYKNQQDKHNKILYLTFVIRRNVPQ